MRKLGRVILVLLAVVVLAVIGIDLFLNEDDMHGCDEPSSGKCAKADAIVAVSGGDTVTRARKAIYMYQAGFADKIIFSGDSADPNSISNAEAMKRVATRSGVSETAIYLEEKSQNTKENAANTVEILKKLGAKNVILVSSPYHLRRVKMNFTASAKDINFRTAGADDSSWSGWYFTPSGWRIAATELAGIAELNAEGK